MGLFDFFKAKELQLIKEQGDRIQELEEEVKALSPYKSIVNIEADIESKLNKLDLDIAERIKTLKQNEQTAKDFIQNAKDRVDELNQRYEEGYALYMRLTSEVKIYNEILEYAEYGIYQPHFEFDTSETYKIQLLELRERIKELVKNNLAVLGGENISWNNSLTAGQAMVKREKKLMLRAFNGESDSFIADVSWNNITRMEERIEKSFNAINKVYAAQGVYITREYADLKLQELRLAYEYKRKLHEEKEEQRAIREQMREEEKVRRDIENALAKAKKEEETYQKALEKARQEIAEAVGDKQEKLQQKISELEARILEAETNRERALSMAQQTRRGHVYIISNIGAFGNDVYKIGMTRRLDPLDRVRELGDASVPFPFDVHAIIYSEDAPALEASLHRAFDHKRMNLINMRKEFFRVTLEEIEQVVHQNGAEIEFTKIAEARDYRETMSKIKSLQPSPEIEEQVLPKTLFAN